MVPRAVHAVNTTPAYLFRKVSDKDGAPTILYDEIDTVFGPKAKDNEDVRGMLNAGHRKGATAGRCVVKGHNVVTEELPAYCAVALAGLDDLPDTIMTRAVVIRMRRRAPSERIEPWRMRTNGPAARALGDRLQAWSASVSKVAWPDMPDGIEDRNADVWEALLAVADLASEQWAERARAAALEIVASNSDRGSGSLGVLLLRDIRSVFGPADRLATDELLERLVQLDEAPWGNLRGKPLDARGLARRLAKYGVKPKVIRAGDATHRGYDAGDLADPWQRYLPVTDVTDVTHPSGDTGGNVSANDDALWNTLKIEDSEEKESPPLSPDLDVTSVTPPVRASLAQQSSRCEHGYAPEQTFHKCDGAI
jgi:hypothetical protein